MRIEEIVGGSIWWMEKQDDHLNESCSTSQSPSPATLYLLYPLPSISELLSTFLFSMCMAN